MEIFLSACKNALFRPMIMESGIHGQNLLSVSIVESVDHHTGRIDPVLLWAQSGQGHDRHFRYSWTNKLLKHQN